MRSGVALERNRGQPPTSAQPARSGRAAFTLSMAAAAACGVSTWFTTSTTSRPLNFAAATLFTASARIRRFPASGLPARTAIVPWPYYGPDGADLGGKVVTDLAALLSETYSIC